MNPYRVGKFVDFSDDIPNVKYFVYNDFKENILFKGTEENCRDFAHMMNKANAEREG